MLFTSFFCLLLRPCLYCVLLPKQIKITLNSPAMWQNELTILFWSYTCWNWTSKVISIVIVVVVVLLLFNFEL